MSDQSANNKRIAEIILSDIMNDVSVANILLKVKLYATKRHDEGLLEWVNAELNGYEGTPPEYRIIPALVKVDVYREFQVVLNQEYPTDMVYDEKIRERLSHISVHNSITEVEELLRKNDGSIRVEVPTVIWHRYMGHCINGNIQRAYQYTSITALSSIITSVKSLLIDFFSKVEEHEKIDFSSVIKSKENVIMNYNAAIINTGDGTVNASNITNVIGDDNTISPTSISELTDILREIKSIIGAQNPECDEICDEINAELSKPTPVKKILKRGFQALRGFLFNVATQAIVEQLPPLLDKALILLQ